MLNNINPALWGRAYWDMLYYIIVAYPENPTISDKKNIYNFFENLGNVIPCEKCSTHYVEFKQKYPLHDKILSNNTYLLSWLVKLNNDVNSRMGKELVTVEDMYKKYTTPIKKYNYTKITIFILLIILIIILVLYARIHK